MNRLIPTNDKQAVDENWTACSDEILVSAAKSGNLAAFNTLCERYSPRTLRKIYCITKDWEDAEDALQDALLKAFTHLKTFEGRCRFSSWFTRIAINSSLMILRKRKVRREVSLDDDGDDPGAWQLPDPRAKSPEALFVQSETRELIRLAVLHLGPRFREVVELRQLHGHSAKVVSRELGITVAAAKSRLSRARTLLRKSPGLEQNSRLRA
jgi:RNA polymerase sigma-70 factor (ECF subfamily)